MNTNYGSNSLNNKENKHEQPKKEVTKVVKGKVQQKKKSEFNKIASSIISDECKSIKEYTIYEVLVPVIKDTISQLIKGSVDMLFYGEVRGGSSSRRSSSNASRVSYSSYYDDRRSDRRDSSRSARYSYDDVSFDYREDANEVLNRMDEIVEQYGVVTVADLFDLVGMTGNGYTDQNYGWTSTRSAEVIRARDGKYIIKIQRPTNIR